MVQRGLFKDLVIYLAKSKDFTPMHVIHLYIPGMLEYPIHGRHACAPWDAVAQLVCYASTGFFLTRAWLLFRSEVIASTWEVSPEKITSTGKTMHVDEIAFINHAIFMSDSTMY